MLGCLGKTEGRKSGTGAFVVRHSTGGFVVRQRGRNSGVWLARLAFFAP